MSSKIIEANAGVHSLAMAVAVRSFLRRSSQWVPDVYACLACHELEIVR